MPGHIYTHTYIICFNDFNSAGVGRTGAFIVIDIELQRAHKEHVVDPFGTVMKLRENRSNIVQTEVHSLCQTHN